MDCKNCDEKQACVPFFAHENVLEHYNRVNRRTLITLCVSLAIMAVGFITLGYMFLSSYNDREKGWQDIAQRMLRIVEVADGVHEQPDP